MLVAQGGILPYSWSLYSGIMTPGLNVGATSGRISGTPDSLGTFCCSVQVEDFDGTTASHEYCISIDEYTDIKGDVNADCAINIVDAVITINIVLEVLVPTQAQLWRADCNGPQGVCDGDGLVSVLDALKIVNVLLGRDSCP
jgi:hypothetical protein